MYSTNRALTDFHRCCLSPPLAKWHPVMADRREAKGRGAGSERGCENSAIPAPVISAETWQIIVEICMSVNLT